MIPWSWCPIQVCRAIDHRLNPRGQWDRINPFSFIILLGFFLPQLLMSVVHGCLSASLTQLHFCLMSWLSLISWVIHGVDSLCNCITYHRLGISAMPGKYGELCTHQVPLLSTQGHDSQTHCAGSPCAGLRSGVRIEVMSIISDWHL